MANENQRPLTTQGDANEIEENLGGTTNLSLDQLKKEGDADSPDNSEDGRTTNLDDGELPATDTNSEA